ncbi:hypothetical protein V1517DRAFT_326794 [Lipomyces orientalis]|uniref:Uncharacterized protein n=1 Tax=Lipomyces orientalis TaxID=1233043 RepID=A0ACC3TKR6_9ASCO
MSSTIYIVYNAKGSIGGKFSYAARKLTASSSPCPACDLTHGGLRLTETKQWRATKDQIGAEVRQLHIDELDQEIVDFVSANSLRYPVVLGKTKGRELELLMTSEDLAGCSGDHSQFLKLLRAKAVEKNVPLDETAVGTSA